MILYFPHLLSPSLLTLPPSFFSLLPSSLSLQADGAFVTQGGRGTGGEVVDMTCGELLVLGRPTIATTIGNQLSVY